MNAIVAQEYEKLNEKQKVKFRELEAWQTHSNPGQPVLSDHAYEQILRWVKASED